MNTCKECEAWSVKFQAVNEVKQKVSHEHYQFQVELDKVKGLLKEASCFLKVGSPKEFELFKRIVNEVG